MKFVNQERKTCAPHDPTNLILDRPSLHCAGVKEQQHTTSKLQAAALLRLLSYLARCCCLRISSIFST
ncbi:hypothetical protein ACHAWU_009053 [Discostella pseudostelligera]|uniref:Uncharacterized protein n=1 Tax=Discostella pseudostelligera TaxID=259834 RepID=A0ABD3MG76_9STRA